MDRRNPRALEVPDGTHIQIPGLTPGNPGRGDELEDGTLGQNRGPTYLGAAGCQAHLGTLIANADICSGDGLPGKQRDLENHSGVGWGDALDAGLQGPVETEPEPTLDVHVGRQGSGLEIFARLGLPVRGCHGTLVLSLTKAHELQVRLRRSVLVHTVQDPPIHRRLHAVG